MSNQTTRLTTQAGVKRDGTRLDSNFFAEAVWSRFVLGRPRKIGGYRNITTFTGPIKKVHTFKKGTENLIHCCSASTIEAVLVDSEGNGAGVYSRTPTGFATYANYSWTLDTAYDMTGSGQSRIYAHAARDDGVPTPVYYGTVDATAALTPITLLDASRPATTGGITAGTQALVLAAATGYAIGDMIRVTGAGAGGVDLLTDITALAGVNATVRQEAGTTVVGAVVNHILGCDGGIVAVGPYLFYYGKNGLIANTDVNNPTLVRTGDANQANPVGSRVVRGMPIIGGGQSPAAIFFTEDSVVTANFVGGTLLFQYDVKSAESSMLSANTVVEYDGAYYWLGLDRAQMFRGAVQEIPNPFNSQWFYDNLNINYAHKVWGTKVTKFGEIWWHFPKGDSTVCNWAIVYNIRENLWYDTPVERSAGYYAQTFKRPVWGDEDGVLWQHEFGWDKIQGEVVTAIESYFVSHDIGLPTGGAVSEQPQGANAWSRIERVEPDFAQVGDMTLEVVSKEYANSPEVSMGTTVFDENTVRVDIRTQARILNLKFRSNVIGGTYWMGVPLLHIDVGDRRE